ncbi:MAG: hypothetical protein HKN60_08705 [Rhizobiales bacterium]|nr:hypothetical protein [Hyphomicrobiales bacterium]
MLNHKILWNYWQTKTGTMADPHFQRPMSRRERDDFEREVERLRAAAT